MDAQSAINSPRFHHQWLPDVLQMEKLFSTGMEDQMKSRGYEVKRRGHIGLINAIGIDPKTNERCGAADPRDNGSAIGYEPVWSAQPCCRSDGLNVIAIANDDFKKPAGQAPTVPLIFTTRFLLWPTTALETLNSYGMQRILSTYLFVSKKLNRELLSQIHGAGFQSVEIFASRSHFDYASKAEIQAIAHGLADNHLQLASLHAPTSRDLNVNREGGSPLSVTEVERVRRVEAMDELKRVIDVAEELQFSRLILHMGGSRETADPRKRDAAFSSLEHLVLHARHVGVTICVENTTSEMGAPAYLRSFVDETRLTGLRSNFDVGHAHLADGPEEERIPVDPLPALHAILDLPLRAVPSNTRAVIVFDEFQGIRSVRGLNAILRSHVQHQRKQASFVFCGSEQGMFDAIFNDPDAPMYGQSEPMRLGRLPAGDRGRPGQEEVRRDRPRAVAMHCRRSS